MLVLGLVRPALLGRCARVRVLLVAAEVVLSAGAAAGGGAVDEDATGPGAGERAIIAREGDGVAACVGIRVYIYTVCW